MLLKKTFVLSIVFLLLISIVLALDSPCPGEGVYKTQTVTCLRSYLYNPEEDVNLLNMLKDLLKFYFSHKTITPNDECRVNGTNSGMFIDDILRECEQDQDDDGMPDGWEQMYGLDPEDPSDADSTPLNTKTDPDDDGLSNLREYELGTNPNNRDTDGDGLDDGEEVELGTGPNNMDTDGDGHTDGNEVLAGSDPTNPESVPQDSDADGMPDFWETANGLNPNDPSDAKLDPDGDGMTNLQEYQIGTNPKDKTTPTDTDKDGIPDAWEILYGFDPDDASDASSDTDNDDYTNLQEYQNGTHPRVYNGPSGSTCSDGTLFGSCSTNKPKYCSNGTLIDNCQVCNCSTGACQTDGSCTTTGLAESCNITGDEDGNGECDYDSTTCSHGDVNCAVEVTVLAISNANPAPGETITAQCTATTPINSINLTVEGVGECEWQSWTANTSRFSCNVGSTATTRIIRCSVDTAKSYKTGTDKTAKINVQPAQTCSDKPDLTVTDIELTPSAPKVGDSVSRVSKVKNLGGVASPVVNIKCYVDDNQTCYGSFGPLDPGATIANYSHNVGWGGAWTAVAGTHKFEWVIDADNHASECNETNNRFVKYLTVGIQNCTENWTCTSWSDCIVEYGSYNGQQTRTCTDLNNCNTTVNKPAETQSCTIGTIPITNCVELQNMKNNLAGDYYLTNDIDCSDTKNWNNGQGFEPIGRPPNRFTGSFDGRKHKITGLFIKRPTTDYVGLFGYTGSTGEVKSVGLENVNIIGKNDVGGLVGYNSATIMSSYSKGNVNGIWEIGGLLGANDGSIANSYSTVNVNGSSSSGGLIGAWYNNGIYYSYSTGRVYGTGSYVGGLIGYKSEGLVITNSYWDIQTSGQTTSAGGTGKTTAEMKQKATFVDWSFDGTWGICEGTTYPWLKWEGITCGPSCGSIVQITRDSYFQGSAYVSGDKIVYYDDRNGNYDIYMYDLPTKQETRITTNPAHQTSPMISGDKIVWADSRNGVNNGDIYMYDLSTNQETQVTTDSNQQTSPSISGDKIMYMDYRHGNEEIYMYDISTGQETRITNDPGKQWRPFIQGNKIVWDAFDTGAVYMHDLSTGQETKISSDSAKAVAPKIYGNKIIWEDRRHTDVYIPFWDEDIYMYDLSANQETQLTTTGRQMNPSIYGNRIVWFENQNNKYSVYLYDLSTGQKSKLADVLVAVAPVIYDNKVVWADNGNVYATTIC